ncbi:hypothetical protein [Streptomyces sp. NPDC058307]|uniref:hypothetical protein n=1 Tax=Streptomyces sp. NPDC058307 TaxID=3346439 RepID=UPI0036EE4BC8
MPLRPPPEGSLYALGIPYGLRQWMVDIRHRHHDWVCVHGADLPEVAEWTWSQ